MLGIASNVLEKTAAATRAAQNSLHGMMIECLLEMETGHFTNYRQQLCRIAYHLDKEVFKKMLSIFPFCRLLLHLTRLNCSSICCSGFICTNPQILPGKKRTRRSSLS